MTYPDVTQSETEAGAGFAAGLIATEPDEINDLVRFHSVVVPPGATHKTIDVEELKEKFAPTPRRKTGVYSVHTAHSFTEFVAKHGDGAEVWADEARQGLVGVLNANRTGDSPAWEDHRVLMELVHTPAWKAWIGVDRKLLDQEDFAELIEARLDDILEPSGADMLEIAETFHATTGLQFKSSKILANGERQLVYAEETTASAGGTGEFEVPKQIVLAIAPFVGGEPRRVIARFRYRINNGRLLLGIAIERPEDILQDAFTELVGAVTAELADDVPVYYGRPA